MRRILTVIFCILLGAVAVAAGMGLYLKQANEDRLRLAAQADRAEQAAKQSQEESRRAVDLANQKISAADLEVAKAQEALRRLQEERDLFARTTPLTAPNSKSLKGWKEAVNMQLGVSLKYPPTSRLSSNDAQGLVIASGSATTTNIDDQAQRWLSVTTYDAQLDNEIIAHLASSTAVAFTAHGKLLLGQKGVLDTNKKPTIVLRVQSNGSTTHLIWAHEPTASKDLSTVMAALSTIDFPQ